MKDKENSYYDPSFDGNNSKKVINNWRHWLPSFFNLSDGEDVTEKDMMERSVFRRVKSLWETWEEVNKIGLLLHPDSTEQEAYGPLCKRLLRRYRLVHTTTRMPYYLHLLAMHGGKYMEHLQSLGKYR
eukprot:TRINITY_DN5402_c0_g5_i1.p1 TRINITY_DN5402_c0_g5~~TRINITY_DN5402_c0_g5_i1.p1  ORF type:complete len:128 (-),score=25.33 TRINITY_DN5402_c0_g5_i1:31-414(-)